METAFAGPLKIQQRIGSVDAATLARYDPDAFVELFKTTPGVHRFPGSMAARVQALCAAIEQDWGGDAAAHLDQGSPDGAEVLKRLKALPGFGEQKAKIFLALLGKQYGFDGRRVARGIRSIRRRGLVPHRRRHHLGRLAREGAGAQARDEIRGEGGVMEPTGAMSTPLSRRLRRR